MPTLQRGPLFKVVSVPDVYLAELAVPREERRAAPPSEHGSSQYDASGT